MPRGPKGEKRRRRRHRHDLIRARVGQHRIDGFAHKRANLVLSRGGHRSQRHRVDQLKQFRLETRSLFVRIICHCADDLDDRFQHQLRGYTGRDVPRRCRFLVLCHRFPLRHQVCNGQL